MKEKDILWESKCERLWIGRTKLGNTLFKNGTTHSRGFLTFGKLSDAIENGEAMELKSCEEIEKFIF